VLNPNMAAKCDCPEATIQAYDIIPLNRSPDRDGRSPYLFFLSILTQVPDGLMNCRDEVGKLAGGEFMMTDVFAHDLGCEVRLVSIGVHTGIPKRVDL
jgi:hypothetical protein